VPRASPIFACTYDTSRLWRRLESLRADSTVPTRASTQVGLSAAGAPEPLAGPLRDSRAERREPAPCTEPEPPSLSGGKCSASGSGSGTGRFSPAGNQSNNTAGQDRPGQEDLIRPTCFNPDVHCKFRPLQLSDRSSKNATKRLRPSSLSRRRSGRSSSGGRARPRACRSSSSK
jgi:hypothetical protein